MIIIRTLRRDIARYNNLDESAEEALEETGWKLVHGDVFRLVKSVMNDFLFYGLSKFAF